MSESVEREEGGVASKSSHSDSDQHERVHEQSDQGDQSDSSIGHPLNFKDGHHSTDLSCNSMKSDRSMDPPLSLRDGHHSTDLSCNSMKSDRSMDPPLSLRDGHHSTEHRDHQKKGLDGQCDQEQQTEPGSLEKERKLRLNLQEELKRSQESIMDLVEDLQRSQKSIMDLQNEKKENTDEITFLLDKIGDAQSSVHLQKTIKEKQARIKEVQEELDAEHAARSNVEKQRDDLHLDLERAERDNRKLEEDLKRSQESIMDLQRDKQQSDHKITEQQALIKELEEAEVRRRSAVDVTLDPDTAHPKLILSDDGKQVYTGNIMKNLPNNKERFDTCVCVLGKQGFSSGRFYFEVQVKSKTEWDLGVARESINRKGNIPLTPNNGYWTIVLRNGNEYEACAGPAVLLPVREKLQTVGVFVDYEEGLVSFYDVEARVLLYSFTGCSFTERLYPYFCPCFNNGGINSAPLIIL